MAQITITINSREYAIACEDGQEVRIIQLARILDEKAKMLNQASGQVNENMLLAMVGLLIADELAELKKNPITTPHNTVGVDNSRLLGIDNDLADKIKKLTQEINSVASNLELL